MFISVRDSHPSKIRLSRLFPDILIEVNLEHPVKSTEVKLELTTSIVWIESLLVHSRVLKVSELISTVFKLLYEALSVNDYNLSQLPILNVASLLHPVKSKSVNRFWYFKSREVS